MTYGMAAIVCYVGAAGDRSEVIPLVDGGASLRLLSVSFDAVAAVVAAAAAAAANGASSTPSILMLSPPSDVLPSSLL